ncbi:MAG: HD-GYP domain-containing protein [Desulfobacteraceae bacterium]
MRLERHIKQQALLYNIIDSLSKINRSEDLYQYMIQKAAESSGASKACFLFYDPSTDSLMALAQQGLPGVRAGTLTRLVRDEEGRPVLDPGFVKRHFNAGNGKRVELEKVSDLGCMVGVPFKIRNQPFGILLVGDKEKESRGFDSEDRFILSFLAEKTALNVENMALYDNLKQSFMATLLSLVGALEAKDPYTQQHSKRVTEYSLRIAQEMCCTQEELEKIESTGPLHDVGKIGIKDDVLNKPGRLTDEEFNMIRSHPLIGVNIVSPLGLAREELAIVRNHHERWDGKGYPDRLQREKTPFLARILAVADAFDAMSSDRAYRSALPESVCLEELRRNSGGQFDPKVVEAALRVLF